MECCGCLTSKNKPNKNKKEKKSSKKKNGGSRNIAELHGDPFQKQQHLSTPIVDKSKTQRDPKRQALQRLTHQAVDLNRNTQITYLSMANQVHYSNAESAMNPISPVTNSHIVATTNADKLFEGNMLSQPSERAIKFANSKDKDDVSSSVSHYQQQTTIYACKTFKFYCSNCYKPFQKLLLHDINMSKEKAVTLANVQDLFNIADNLSCNCPFCNENITLILNTSLIVGNYEQMEQFDLINSAENLNLIESEYDTHLIPNKNLITSNENDRVHATLEVNMSDNQVKLHQNDGDLETLSKNSGSNPRNLIFKIHRPVVIRHKLQQLKDPKKYAQMIIIGDQKPQFKSTFGGIGQVTKTTNIESEDIHNTSNNVDNTQIRYHTPEMFHKIDQKQCTKFNKDIMRAIVNKKMRKNKSYLELKVLPQLQQQQSSNKKKKDIKQTSNKVLDIL